MNFVSGTPSDRRLDAVDKARFLKHFIGLYFRSQPWSSLETREQYIAADVTDRREILAQQLELLEPEARAFLERVSDMAKGRKVFSF